MRMKKLKFIIPLAALGMVLASCGEATFPFTPDEEFLGNIDEPFVPYELPIEEVEFKAGEERLILDKGDTFTYTYYTTPKKAPRSSLNWTSSNTNVATVANGVVSAIGGGIATITVDGGEKGTFDPIDLSVTVRVKLTGFSLDTFDLDYGETKVVAPTLEPSDTTEPNFIYSINDESVATVDENGTITAKSKSGQAILTVTSETHPELTHETTITVSDKVNYVKKLDVALEDANLEVGKAASLSYTVESINGGDPTAPLTDIKYYTTTPEILSVDEKTGEVTALEPGEGKVHAELYEARKDKSFVGDDFTVNVFEYKATSLTIKNISKSTQNINNKSYEPIKIEYEYETDPMDKEPSRPNVSITSSDPNVVVVNENNYLSIVGKGEARVTVNDSQYGVSDYFDVNVTILATAVEAIADANTAYIGGSPVTISGKITPEGVSDDTVKYEITEGNEFVSSTVVDGKLQLTALKEGTVKVVAKTGGLTSEEKYITVDEPEAAFVAGHPYIVGNTKYKGGVATDNGHDSWFLAKYAYAFLGSSTEGNKTQFSVLAFQFKEGNEWKIKEGNDGWRDIGTKDVAPGYYQIEEGAFATGAMGVENNNIHVKKDGYYDIYYDIYDRGTEAEFFKVYVGEHILAVDKSSLELDHAQVGELQLNNWVGAPVASIKEGSDDCIEISQPDEHGKITVTAKEVNGNATILITDDNDLQPNTLEVNVKVEKVIKKHVYVNANGIMDSEGAKIVAHAWKDDTHFGDYQFSQVSAGSYIYTAEINEKYDNILFARANAETGEWFNQTADLTFEEGKDMWTMIGYSDAALVGYWGTYHSEYNYSFDPNKTYIVGNKDFHDLEAQTDAASWDNVDAAHELSWNDTEKQHELLDVFFAKDTEFRFRNNCYYGAELIDDASGNIEMVGDNFHVKQNGRYNLYFKDGKLYATLGASLSLDHDNIIVNKSAEYVVTVNNSHGDLTVTGIDTTKATAVADNNTKKITVTGVEYGDTSFTVTDGDGASAICQVHVGIPFESNKIYIVGDKDYSSGTSVDDGASWNTSDKACLVGTKVVPASGDPDNEISATITFAEGDKWRMRVGDEYPADNVKEESGALVGRQMHKDGFNFVVDVAGTYTIYIKTGSDSGHSIYIGAEDTTRVVNMNPYTEVAGGGAWFALWAWKDSGAGRFYYGKPVLFQGDTTPRTLVVVPKECNMFKVLRMESGIDPTSNWFDIDNYDSFKDHIWNASGDLEHPTKFDCWNLEYFFGDGSICVTNFN